MARQQRWSFYPHPVLKVEKNASKDLRAEAAKLGLTLVQWHAQQVDRARAAIAAIRPHRDPKPVNVDRERDRYLGAGAHALAEVDADVAYFKRPGSKKWIVRVYYVSQGDEVLCFDCGPFGAQQAGNMTTAIGPAQRHRGVPMPHEIIDVAELGADAIAQERVRQPLYGARLVLLPSQVREPSRCDVAPDEVPILAALARPAPAQEFDGFW